MRLHSRAVFIAADLLRYWGHSPAALLKPDCITEVCLRNAVSHTLNYCSFTAVTQFKQKCHGYFNVGEAAQRKYVRYDMIEWYTRSSLEIPTRDMRLVHGVEKISGKTTRSSFLNKWFCKRGSWTFHLKMEQPFFHFHILLLQSEHWFIFNHTQDKFFKPQLSYGACLLKD